MDRWRIVAVVVLEREKRVWMLRLEESERTKREARSVESRETEGFTTRESS